MLLISGWLVIPALLAEEDVGAPAEQLPAGHLDAACASDCGERGYEVSYCARACWVPESGGRLDEAVTDGVCLASCRQRGGLFDTCRRVCRRD